jgi:hypothetical protein
MSEEVIPNGCQEEGCEEEGHEEEGRQEEEVTGFWTWHVLRGWCANLPPAPHPFRASSPSLISGSRRSSD